MRDSKTTVAAAFVLVLAVAAAPAHAQGLPGFAGTWNLDVEAIEPQVDPASAAPILGSKQGEPCLYSGTVTLSQDGAQVAGPAELFLVSGPASCPAEMSGNLTGTITTGELVGSYLISGMIDGSDPSGVVSFSGSLSPNPGGSGDFAVTQGDFLGTSGSWMAVLQQSIVDEIPVLGRFGLALLTALLLAGGAWILARSHAT